MNPHSKEGSATELTPPVVEQAPVPAGSSEKSPDGPYQGAEKASGASERSPAFQPLATMTAATPAIPLPLPPMMPTATPATGSAVSVQSASLAAKDDGDLIEKEWVDKAKQIVERTRDDPYKQSEELTVFKADYMKKRYGKTIKVSQ